MFLKSLQKAQMSPPVVANSLFYAPEDALLQLESLKILLYDSAYTYPINTLGSNEYLKESHAKLFRHITGLLQDHYISTVDLPHISPNISSYPTFFSSDIP